MSLHPSSRKYSRRRAALHASALTTNRSNSILAQRQHPAPPPIVCQSRAHIAASQGHGRHGGSASVAAARAYGVRSPLSVGRSTAAPVCLTRAGALKGTRYIINDLLPTIGYSCGTRVLFSICKQQPATLEWYLFSVRGLSTKLYNGCFLYEC